MSVLKKNYKTKQQCLDYIDVEVDNCLQLETRTEQNKAFSELRPSLPIHPIKMTTTTAVFLYNYDGEIFVIKRVICREDNPSQEPEISLNLKHKNLLRTFECFERFYVNMHGVRQKIVWLISEYLNEKISMSSVKGDEIKIRDIMRDVLKGLAYMHEVMNIAHLDLKIANIMGNISFEDKSKDRPLISNIIGKKKSEQVEVHTYKIIDFGYSRDMSFSKNTSYNLMERIPGKSYGTFPYKPPEVVLGNLHGKKSDIYCIGEIALFLSKKAVPFYLKNKEKDTHAWRKHLEADNPVIEFANDSSEEFKDFVTLCLRKNPEERPTARQLLTLDFFTKDSSTFTYLDNHESSYFSNYFTQSTKTCNEENIERKR